MHSFLPLILALPSLALGCAEHTFARDVGQAMNRRANDVKWTYDKSYDWHTLDPAYEKCQTGTQQSPIGLNLNQGLSASHVPVFSFPGLTGYADKNAGNNKSAVSVTAGEYHNWGYGPAFAVPKNSSAAPTITFDNITATMAGWHVHAPADHSAGGDRSKAELHIVWVDKDSGRYVAVTGVRLDPGRAPSAFFTQFDNVPKIRWDDSKTRVPMTVDFGHLLGDATRNLPGHFNEFWTYEGSLTSPPCTEGIRWFVARNIHWLSNEQMQKLLAVSTFSARPEQEVWMQRVNA